MNRTSDQSVIEVENGYAFIDLDDRTSFRTRLARMPALGVTREDDPGIFRDHFAFVYVAERPVLISARPEAIDAARGVDFVTRSPVQ